MYSTEKSSSRDEKIKNQNPRNMNAIANNNSNNNNTDTDTDTETDTDAETATADTHNSDIPLLLPPPRPPPATLKEWCDEAVPASESMMSSSQLFERLVHNTNIKNLDNLMAAAHVMINGDPARIQSDIDEILGTEHGHVWFYVALAQFYQNQNQNQNRNQNQNQNQNQKQNNHDANLPESLLAPSVWYLGYIPYCCFGMRFAAKQKTS